MSTSTLATMVPRLAMTHHKGEVKDGRPHGQGDYLLVDGSVYSGQFYEGLFHGNGSLKFPNGDHFDGVWSLGQLVSGALTFADGLSCPPSLPPNQSADLVSSSTQSVAPSANPIISQWKYCTDADRRFWNEHINGPQFDPIGQARLTNHDHQDLLPFGCYDVSDGYLHVHETALSLSAVYDYVSAQRLRATQEEEIQWARVHCRIGDNPDIVHRHDSAYTVRRPVTASGKSNAVSRPRTAAAAH